MTNTFFKWTRSFHAWVGAGLALILLVTAVTGTLLVWKQAYLKLVIPAARAQFNPTPATLAPLLQKIEQQFEANKIRKVQLPTEDFALAKVTLADTNYAYVTPQGEVVDAWHMNERPEEWLYDLHHRLLLGNTGLAIIGVVGIATLLLLVAGLVAYWPLRGGLRQGFRIRSLSLRHLRTAHRNIGLIEALPLILLLATGIVLAFPTWVEQTFLQPVRTTQEYSDSLVSGLDDISGGSSGDWLPAMRRALATFPAGSDVRSVEVPNQINPYRIIGVKQPGEWHPDGKSLVYIAARGGWMDIRYDATELPAIERAYNLAYPLHTGRIGSLGYKILLTIVGTILSLLCVLGLTSFVKEKWPGRNRSSTRRPDSPTPR